MASPSSPQTALLATPLHALHRRIGARMVDFAGWDMPVQYPTGILAEHQAVRSACGLFDLSHMGRVFLLGRDALALAQECCTRDLARIRPGEAAYSMMCAPDGGILDDVIVYVLGDDNVWIVFNASNRLADIRWFERQRDQLGLKVDVEDLTLSNAPIGRVAGRARRCAATRVSDPARRPARGSGDQRDVFANAQAEHRHGLRA